MQCSPTEGITRIARVFAIQTKNNQTMVPIIDEESRMVKHTSVPYLGPAQSVFPGGKAEKDERKLTVVAAREFNEETGYLLNSNELSNKDSIFVDTGDAQIRVYFLAKEEFEYDHEVAVEDHVLGMRWVPLARLSDFLSTRNLRFAHNFIGQPQYQNLLMDEFGVPERTIKKFLNRTVAKIGV